MDYDQSPQRLESSLRLSCSKSRFRNSKIADSDFDMTNSRISHDVTLHQLLQDTSLTVAMKIESTVEALENGFYRVLRDSVNTEIIENIAKLIQTCNAVSESIESWNRFEIQNAWLAEEINTWKLLLCLYSDSLVEKKQFLELLGTNKPEICQQKLVNVLFQSDGELRLFQLLVDWLESCAASQDEAVPAFGRINSSVHWENTLHYLVNSSNLFNRESNNLLVTRIDPDARHRQKKNIHALDQQDDENLCRRIFAEIRCGRFEEAVALCTNSGQMWRGATLQGWRLLTFSDTGNIIGNPNRDLWKLCCMDVLNNPNENVYFKAALGVLCGHLPSVLRVCSESVEDLLWAHMRVQIECRIDKFLREHFSSIYASTSSADSLDLLNSELQIREISLNQIFASVTSLMEGSVESYYQVVRRHLMLGSYDAFMRDAKEWTDDVDLNFVRFLAHFVLILRDMAKEPDRATGDAILETYVAALIKNVDCRTVHVFHENPELLAYYTSKLPRSVQIRLYAQLMSCVEGSENRRRIMDTGTEAGVDVAASAVQTVRDAIILLRGQTTHLSHHMHNRNQYVLDSLEWLSFNASQIKDAVYYSNNIIRTLIFMNDIDAAVAVLTRILQLISVNGLISLDPNSNMLKEHLCLKAYLEATDAFANWYRRYVGGRPASPEPIPSDASYPDKVHHEQKCAQITQQRARWNKASLHQARHTKKIMYNLLLFPGGWLVDINSDESSEIEEGEIAERKKQLVTLRQLCIPEITQLLLRVLQTGPEGVDGHIEAIRLANILASDKRCLYKVFPKDKLSEILQKIKDSSLFVMENGKDPWGFEHLH